MPPPSGSGKRQVLTALAMHWPTGLSPACALRACNAPISASIRCTRCAVASARVSATRCPSSSTSCNVTVTTGPPPLSPATFFARGSDTFGCACISSTWADATTAGGSAFVTVASCTCARGAAHPSQSPLPSSSASATGRCILLDSTSRTSPSGSAAQLGPGFSPMHTPSRNRATPQRFRLGREYPPYALHSPDPLRSRSLARSSHASVKHPG